MPNKIKYPIVNGLKECGDCHQWKPINEFNKARNYYTSRCKDCLQVYYHNYREKPEIKTKQQVYQKEYISNPQNREKKNAYLRKYRKQRRVRDVLNKSRKQWSLEQKLKAIEYKGGKCQICRYAKYTGALEFHHQDPSKKEGYGTASIAAHKAFQNNLVELDKCILVCVRCHREIHATEEL